MDWTISISFLILGALVGYFVCRLQMSSSAASSAAQAKTDQLEAELNQYKQDVEQHFASSATLLDQMASDYKKIYQHMTQSQQSLLPDSDLTIEAPFLNEKALTVEPESMEDTETNINAANDESSHQPNDYVQGSHGIIRPDEKESKEEKASA